jgi:hypothetical protein
MRTIGRSEHNLAAWKRAILSRITPSGDEITVLEDVDSGTCIDCWWPKEGFEGGVSAARGSQDPAFREELGDRTSPEGNAEVGQRYCVRAPCIIYEYNGERHRVIVCETGVRTGPRRFGKLALSR